MPSYHRKAPHSLYDVVYLKHTHIVMSVSIYLTLSIEKFCVLLRGLVHPELSTGLPLIPLKRGFCIRLPLTVRESQPIRLRCDHLSDRAGKI